MTVPSPGAQNSLEVVSWSQDCPGERATGSECVQVRGAWGCGRASNVGGWPVVGASVGVWPLTSLSC